MRKLIFVFSISIFVIFSTLNTFAGWLQMRTQPGQWYYQEGMYLCSNEWKLIDNKYYYFMADGRLQMNGVTPDGYTVNANGEWTVNGVVQGANPSYIIANTINNVTSNSSKLLYKQKPSLSSCSLQSKVTLDGKEYRNNVYRFSKGGRLKVTPVNKYTSFEFQYMVKSPNENNEYLLEIYVNNELSDEIDSVSNTPETYVVDFEIGEPIELRWYVNTEDGSSSSSATQLYVVNGNFYK